MRRTMTRTCLVLATVLWVSTVAQAGRYEQFTQKAAQGPKMKAVNATYFGSEGIEEFTAAAAPANGGVIAFGNAWGPQFPTQPKPVVLGQGEHRGLKAVTERKGKKVPDDTCPDKAGMIVYYGPDLTRILRVVRFDWGVATISAGILSGDGKGLVIAGRCSDAFRELAREAKVMKTLPAQDGRRWGPYKVDGVEVSGDTYVARMNPVTNKLEWVWIFEGHREPAWYLKTDGDGNIYFQCRGSKRIAADGAVLAKLYDKTTGDKVGIRAVEEDGEFWFGGDRNTNTGREPWRQPFLYKYDATGNQKLVTLYEYPPKALRDGKGNEEGMVSDSAIRSGVIAPNGDLIMGGWSDGGNSILTRQPTDVSKKTPESAFGMSSWGMKNANSLAYLLRMDTNTNKIKAWTLWVSYVPDTFMGKRYRNSPNFASIKGIRMLDNGSIAFHGGAATGLIQTPNAFYKHPSTGRKYGGDYVAVFDPSMRVLLFSSYMPGCRNVQIAPAKDHGLVAVSRSSGDDGREDPTTPTPVSPRAVQKEKKGLYDAHIVLLRLRQ